MNRALLLVCLVICCPAPVAFAQLGKPDKPNAALAATMKDLATDLKEARELLPKVTDRPTRDRLELLITRSELKLVELDKSLAGITLGSSAPVALSAENFAKLLKGLKAESFDDGKVSFVKNFATNGRLTCDQAKELLAAFSFDDGRGQAAVLLYPRLTDPENFYTVLEVFTFDSSRKSVREKLKLNK